jgi:hypothetical protein
MWLSTIGIIASLVLAVLTAPLAANAQPATKVYRIGFVRPSTASATAKVRSRRICRWSGP